MVRKGLMLTVWLLCLLSVQAQESAIAAVQQKRFEAMVNKDTAYLRSCTDKKLVYIHSNGLIQRQDDFVQSVATGSIVYQQITSKEQTIRMYKKAAVANGVVHVKGQLNGKDFEVDLRYTDVYVSKKSGWKMVSWQSLKL
jgi:hypothetical protein